VTLIGDAYGLASDQLLLHGAHCGNSSRCAEFRSGLYDQPGAAGTATTPVNAAGQTVRQLGPIPKAGPLAQPKSVDQVGLPAERTRKAIPPENPQTPEKISLGEKLFFDGRLSAAGTVACSSCHDPARAFSDGRPVSIGINGRAGQRNAPTILNALYNKSQFWDGRVKTLEEQAALPIVNPDEIWASLAWMPP
jgi:cytochrome c peroxidase